MNPTLFGLIVLAGVGMALCALLVIAGGLIHTSLRRNTATLVGSAEMSSRILDDLRPVKGLLVEFVRHSHELTSVLSVLSFFNVPIAFARLVHEIRIDQDSSANAKIAANLVGPALFILGLAGLIRVTASGFAITAVGREVLGRIGRRSQQVVQAVLVEQETQPTAASQEGRNQLTHNIVVTKETNIMNRNKRNIIITAADQAELEAVIIFTGKVSERARVELSALEGELQRAKIVEPEEIPSDVITMNSRAELLDLESKERMRFTLVLPRDARIEEGKISVLAPLGTAMLGYRVGDEFQWRVPYGVRRLKVTNVYFQPEAALKKAA